MMMARELEQNDGPSGWNKTTVRVVGPQLPNVHVLGADLLRNNAEDCARRVEFARELDILVLVLNGVAVLVERQLVTSRPERVVLQAN